MYSEEVVGVLNMINKTLIRIDEEIRSLSARATLGSDGRTTITVP
jgi:hypothetical protein